MTHRATNAGILERYFETMILSRLMAAWAKLDHLAASSPETKRIFSEARDATRAGET